MRIPVTLKLPVTRPYLEPHKFSPISVASFFIFFYLCLRRSGFSLSSRFLPTVSHKFTMSPVHVVCLHLHICDVGAASSSNCYNHIPDYTA